MKAEKDTYYFSVIFLGNYQVGKTALAQRLCNDIYEPEKLKVTYGVGFMTKELVVDNKKIVLNIRDTAGDERYHSLMKMYYNEVHGVFIVYDISNKNSLDKIKFWVDDLDINGNSMERRVLVGNKTDLDKTRQVTQLEAKTLATNRHMDWCECSAKTGEGVSDVLELLIRKMLSEYERNPDYRKIGIDDTFVSLSASICPVAERAGQHRDANTADKKPKCC